MLRRHQLAMFWNVIEPLLHFLVQLPNFNVVHLGALTQPQRMHHHIGKMDLVVKEAEQRQVGSGRLLGWHGWVQPVRVITLGREFDVVAKPECQ